MTSTMTQLRDVDTDVDEPFLVVEDLTVTVPDRRTAWSRPSPT